MVLPFFVFGAAVLIAVAACDSESPVTRLLGSRWLVSCGGISYGLYLWHPVFLYAFGLSFTLPAVLASFVVARLSYVYVEQPFLRRRRRTARRARPRRRGPARRLALARDAVTALK